MTKPQIIQEIMTLNRSASLEFLQAFEVHDLRRYLERLHGLQRRCGRVLQPESRQELIQLLEPRCPLGIN